MKSRPIDAIYEAAGNIAYPTAYQEAAILSVASRFSLLIADKIKSIRSHVSTVYDAERDDWFTTVRLRQSTPPDWELLQLNGDVEIALMGMPGPDAMAKVLDVVKRREKLLIKAYKALASLERRIP